MKEGFIQAILNKGVLEKSFAAPEIGVGIFSFFILPVFGDKFRKYAFLKQSVISIRYIYKQDLP